MIDVSFISLTLILPNAFELVTPDGVILGINQTAVRAAARRTSAAAASCAILRCMRRRRQSIVDFVAHDKRLSVDRHRGIRYHRNGWEPGIFHMSPKTIGLIAHTGKVRRRRAGQRVWLRISNKRVFRSPCWKKIRPKSREEIGLKTIADLGREADLLVVLGGDGTILHVVGAAGRS